MTSVKEILKQYNQLNKKIQSEYDEKVGYASRFSFLYQTIMKSQKEFIKYKKNEMFSEKYFNDLIETINSNKNFDENQLTDLVFEKIIVPLSSPHISLKPLEMRSAYHSDPISEKAVESGTLSEEKNLSFFSPQNSDQTLVIKIKSFSKKHIENDNEIFKELKESLKSHQYENIIIDLRGNSGGTDEYFKHFSILTQKAFPFKEKFKDLFLEKTIEVESNYIQGNPENNEYNRFLLVDKEVFSSAETFALLCKQTGFATVVGEKTKGEGYGFTPLTIQITKSNYTGKFNPKNFLIEGLEITIPTAAPVNEKGQIDYKNFYNTTPDILCEGKDALEVVIAKLKQEKLEKEENNNTEFSFHV